MISRSGYITGPVANKLQSPVFVLFATDTEVLHRPAQRFVKIGWQTHVLTQKSLKSGVPNSSHTDYKIGFKGFQYTKL